MPEKAAGCARTVLSCARCRKKKIKCDRRMPCSQCQISHIECTGYSAGAVDDVPRSIVQYLESEISRLEVDLGYTSQKTASEAPKKPPAVISNQFQPLRVDKRRSSARDLARQRLRASASIQAIISATTPSSQSSPIDISRRRMNLTPSLTLAPTSRNEPHSESPVTNAKASLGLSIRTLVSIPPAVVITLVKTYLQRANSLLPFLHEATVWEQTHRVLRIVHEDKAQAVFPDFDFLIVYIVLAASVSHGSAKADVVRRMAFSETLFREGIQHLWSQTIFPSDLAELQLTISLLHYATINPRCASVWMLCGAAMRSCLELGLHRELPSSANANDLTIDLRRRVFWISCCMDRHTCAALRRPISITDSAINTRYFSVFDDSAITAEGTKDDGPPTKTPALHWLEYRQLHSTMVEVHFQGRALEEGQTWDDWVNDMEEKLRNWYEKEKGRASYEWTETAYTNARTYLHRPSPRTPMPSPQSLLIAFENACSVAQSYRNDMRSGYFRRPWLAAHHTFGSALIVLFCLRHGSEMILSKFDAELIFDMTKLFTLNLLSISSSSWPEVSQYGSIYESLLAPLIESLFRHSDASNAFTPEQDAELATLLYPGSAQLERLRRRTISVPALLNDDFTQVDSFNWDFSQLESFNWDDDLFSVAGDFTEVM